MFFKKKESKKTSHNSLTQMQPLLTFLVDAVVYFPDPSTQPPGMLAADGSQLNSSPKPLSEKETASDQWLVNYGGTRA